MLELQSKLPLVYKTFWSIYTLSFANWRLRKKWGNIQLCGALGRFSIRTTNVSMVLKVGCTHPQGVRDAFPGGAGHDLTFLKEFAKFVTKFKEQQAIILRTSQPLTTWMWQKLTTSKKTLLNTWALWREALIGTLRKVSCLEKDKAGSKIRLPSTSTWWTTTMTEKKNSLSSDMPRASVSCSRRSRVPHFGAIANPTLPKIGQIGTRALRRFHYVVPMRGWIFSFTGHKN